MPSATTAIWPLDEEIRRDSTAAVLGHPLGALFADLGALDLVRLHRLHLVLVGLDEIRAAATRGDEGGRT